MSKGRDRIVFRDDDGQWKNKRHDAGRASSSRSTQAEAEKAAREMLKIKGEGS